VSLSKKEKLTQSDTEPSFAEATEGEKDTELHRDEKQQDLKYGEEDY
jgi:hypothetical protein